MQATVKYISNGYTIQSAGGPGLPALLYAATIPEVVFWLGKVFDPLGTNPAAMSQAAEIPSPSPRTIVNDDPLNNQESTVTDLENGGFIVRQMSNPPGNPQGVIDIWCVNMDAVADTLTQIYTPPVQQSAVALASAPQSAPTPTPPGPQEPDPAPCESC